MFNISNNYIKNNNSQILSRTCGEYLIFFIKSGKLSIKGEEKMNDYRHDNQNFAPWYENHELNQTVKTLSGVTSAVFLLKNIEILLHHHHFILIFILIFFIFIHTGTKMDALLHSLKTFLFIFCNVDLSAISIN